MIYIAPKETSSSTAAKTNLSQDEVSTLKEQGPQPGLCQLNDGLLLDEVDEDLGG